MMVIDKMIVIHFVIEMNIHAKMVEMNIHVQMVEMSIHVKMVEIKRLHDLIVMKILDVQEMFHHHFDELMTILIKNKIHGNDQIVNK